MTGDEGVHKSDGRRAAIRERSTRNLREAVSFVIDTPAFRRTCLPLFLFFLSFPAARLSSFMSRPDGLVSPYACSGSALNSSVRGPEDSWRNAERVTVHFFSIWPAMSIRIAELLLSTRRAVYFVSIKEHSRVRHFFFCFSLLRVFFSSFSGIA